MSPTSPTMRSSRGRILKAAPRDGWWLSTVNTPRGRDASSPRSQPVTWSSARALIPAAAAGDLVGVCVIGMTAAWDDVDTGKREHAACLVPLTKFTHPVPRSIARRHGRLRVPSLSRGQQLPGPEGPARLGPVRTSSGTTRPNRVRVRHPTEALAEPDTARLAARLRASDTGTASSSSSGTTPFYGIGSAGSMNVKPNDVPRHGRRQTAISSAVSING